MVMTMILKKIYLLLLILTLPLLLISCNRASQNIREAAEEESLPIIGEGTPTLPEIEEENQISVPQQLIVKTEEKEIIDEITRKYQAEIVSHLPEFNHYLLEISPNNNIEPTINSIRKHQQVDFAQPNFVVIPSQNKQSETEPDFSKLDYFFRGHQWGMHKIQAPSAWEVTTGSNNTVIAVVDTGVDYNHPDFGDRVLYEEGINTIEEENPTAVLDDNGHGTHVAGIAAAGGPGEGNMAGVNWNTLILPIKVLNQDGYGSSFSVNQGLEHVRQYAQDNPDKRVTVNLSLNFFGHSPARDEVVSSLLQENIVIVCAIGNDYKNILTNPDSSPGVIAVGATDVRDEKASFSSEGSWISIVAPGEEVFSSVPGGYDSWDGTSMSAPFVAGTAALLLDKYPELSPADIKHHLEITADDLGTTGFNYQYGHGRLNAARALTTEPQSSPKANINFSITSTQQPANNIIIRLYHHGQYHHFVTSVNGNASFYNLKAGKYRADFVYDSETLKQINFTLQEGEDKKLDISL